MCLSHLHTKAISIKSIVLFDDLTNRRNRERLMSRGKKLVKINLHQHVSMLPRHSYRRHTSASYSQGSSMSQLQIPSA